MQLGRGCKSDPPFKRLQAYPMLCKNFQHHQHRSGRWPLQKKFGRAHKGRLSFVVNYEKISSLEFVGPCFYDHRSLRGSSANGT